MSFGPMSALGARFRHGVPVFKPQAQPQALSLKCLSIPPFGTWRPPHLEPQSYL